MDDLLSEGEQWEAVKAWLRSNGAALLAGLALGALGLFGWRWWDARTERVALEAAGKYQQLLAALDRAEVTVATAHLDELKKNHGSSAYVGPAELALARVHVASNEMEQAANALRNVMTQSEDEQLRLVARLRLARVQLSQGKADEALATLGTLPQGSAFAARYAEVRGDVLHFKGDRAGALKEYLAARDAGSAADQGGVADAGHLELKINDLKAGS